MFENIKMNYVKKVEILDKTVPTFDIEIDSELHAFVAKHESGAIGVSHNSACISLSNLSDERMRSAKSGQWWIEHPERALANNSVAYTEKPDIGIFMKEWMALYESKSGERGLFNRAAAVSKMKKIGRRDFKKYEENGGVNPCSEAILRNQGLCNLSTIVVRSNDTLEDLIRKVSQAAIIGTFQSTLTNFRYLRANWRKNAEEERLLGVSMVGIMDHEVLAGKHGLEKTAQWLDVLRETVIETNKIWAEKLGINQSVATTVLKPEGTTSQLVDGASGIHARYAPYYIRTVRSDKHDPLGQYLRDMGVPCEDDVMNPSKTWVFSFPQKAPKNAVFRDDMTAIEQLNHYLVYYKHWAEHTVSITVYVRENEWLDVAAWVYSHFDEVGGISFLPHSSHSYAQAPYQEITEEKYNELMEKMPVINWADFFEETDNVEGAQQLACSAGVCEL